jgi:Zn-dependent metalloprotease
MSRYAKNDARRVGRFLNSGIPGHAFYLLATKLGGYAWEKAGMIWYRALSGWLARFIASASHFPPARRHAGEAIQPM